MLRLPLPLIKEEGELNTSFGNISHINRVVMMQGRERESFSWVCRGEGSHVFMGFESFVA